MTRATLVIVALVSLTNCQRSDSNGAATSTADSSGVRITTINISPSTLDEWTLAPASELTLTGAETGDSTGFAYIGSARWLKDGRIVVVDASANRLLLFDRYGKFVRPFGRRGQGPGEFRSITSLTVLPGDSLLTFDGSLRRLTLWHPDSGYVRSMRVGGTSLESWPADAWLWPDGGIVVLQLSITPRDSIPPGSGVRRWPMRARLTLQDTSGKPLASSPEFEASTQGFTRVVTLGFPFQTNPSP